MLQELFSFAVHEHMLVAGGQGEVIFWDRRSPAQPVATLSDTHMQDVTQVVRERGKETAAVHAARGKH